MAKRNEDAQHRDSTLAALLKEKPRRGRPKHAVSRQSVYVSLSKTQKHLLKNLAQRTPLGIKRADIPDMAIMLLSTKLNKLRQAVSERERELPEGITDMEGLYYLWDLKIESADSERRWTSIRLSPTWAVEFGRLQGTFNALFGANRSEVFDLAIASLDNHVAESAKAYETVQDFQSLLDQNA